MSALVEVGLTLEFLHEFPFTVYDMFPAHDSGRTGEIANERERPFAAVIRRALSFATGVYYHVILPVIEAADIIGSLLSLHYRSSLVEYNYKPIKLPINPTVTTVTALLMLKFGLTPSVDNVTYHHWWDINSGERVLDKGEGHAIKTCPGTGFFGGNSTASAKNNFYPLVSQKMQKF